jgi:putative ABC transport system permease protein
MTAAVPPMPAELPGWRLSRILLIGLRELRGGLKGFAVFVACVALGVAVIAGIGALADALRSGFERQGEVLLGGDATLSRPHRAAEPAERTWMSARGRVSETATLRGMARRVDGSEQMLIELKGVDAAYPLVGEVKLRGGMSLATALRGPGSAAVDPILLERLGLKVGDEMQLGRSTVTIRALIESEPDKVSDRLTFGPRVFVSLATLTSTGLAEPGSLVRWRYALSFATPSAPGEAGTLVKFRDEVKRDLAEGGFTVADRRDPHPRVTKTLDRLQQFLTLIGLTALLVGGVGVANAVSTFIDRRRKVIATFKSLGASARLIFTIHLAQVMVIAGLGVLIGLAIGLLLPALARSLLADILPVQLDFVIRPWTLLMAASYGVLVSLLFSLWPLGRAELIRPSVLFREESVAETSWPRWRIIALTVLVGVALFSLAIVPAESKRIAFYVCAGLVAIFAIFIVLGQAITVLARHLPRPRNAELALALRSLGAPGGLTRNIVLSLGTGLSLLVTVALTNSSIVAELTDRLPSNSPDYFVLDLPESDLAGFRDFVMRESNQAHINHAPMLRGRLVTLAGKPVEQIKAPAEAQWVLSGDRGLTYSEAVPEGSTVVAGEWWPPNYTGPALVSFEAELARLLDLKLGDLVTVNVLGRNLTARIANLRDVKWESLSINFVMVFSPNALQGAPHHLLATIALPKDISLGHEAALAKAIGKAYPAITVVRVKEALDAFNAIFGRIMWAVRVAGAVTLLAGALVLAGALATSQRRRIKQAVILKVLGATRARILRAHFAEYAMLASISAVCAVALGTLGAWFAVRMAMEVPFVFSWSAVGLTVALSLALVLIFGGMGTMSVLRARPVPYLRSE